MWACLGKAASSEAGVGHAAPAVAAPVGNAAAAVAAPAVAVPVGKAASSEAGVGHAAPADGETPGPVGTITSFMYDQRCVV